MGIIFTYSQSIHFFFLNFITKIFFIFLNTLIRETEFFRSYRKKTIILHKFWSLSNKSNYPYKFQQPWVPVWAPCCDLSLYMGVIGRVTHGPEVKSACEKDKPTSFDVVRACALHGYAADSSRGLDLGSILVLWSDLLVGDTLWPCVVERHGWSTPS